VKDPLIESVKPKTNWYVILRAFDGSGVSFVRGEVVDVSGWRHTGVLEQRRYIAPLPYGAEVPAELLSGGVKRRMLNSVPEFEQKKRKKN
jgi:hypothetical protein